MDKRTSIPYQVDIEVFSYEPDELVIVTNEQLIVGMETPYHVEAYYQKKLLRGIADIKVISTFNILEDAKKIHAAKKAEGKVSAFYHGLTAEKKIVSVLPLEVILPKREVLLPVDESFNLKVIGGSGYHIFESKNKDIAIVSFNG